GWLAALTSVRWTRRTLVALVGGAVAAAALGRATAYAPTPEPARPYGAPAVAWVRAGAPNLVLVTIDTLRRDHLDVYGYDRATAPQLATLAREGTVFDAAVAQAPETLHSLASLMTGLYPPTLDREFAQRERRGPFLGSAFHTLAERLAAAGYDTAGFVSNVYLRGDNGFAQGFRHYDDRSGMFWAGAEGRGKRAQHVVDPAVAWLATAVRPFFLWVHLMDPHHPYEPAAPGPWEDAAPAHAAAYDGLPLEAYTRRLQELRPGRRAASAGEIAYLVGRYDAEILHADRQLGRLRAELAAHGFDARNTMLVVTADHGEEFHDHARLLHGHSLFDELVRVPLVVHGAGIPAARRIAGQVRLVDVAPTLLDVAGIADADLDGATLLAGLAAGELPSRPALAFLERRYVAYRTPEWKLVAAFDPYDLEPPSLLPWRGLAGMARVALGRPHCPRIGLWRLADDGGERRDLAAAAPDRFAEVYAELVAERRARPPRAVASVAEPDGDRRGRRTLRALGYVQ
ncbi:MAG TPA: sulfatase, partial [Candidatus Binatia bacterium]|nr:sulfatase [Candidatus Binatia bacterium]